MPNQGNQGNQGGNQGNRGNLDNLGNQGNRGSNEGRGFAGMDDDKQRRIASEGGKAAHEKGTAHEFSSDEAREAGRKGGEASGGGNRGGGNR